MESNESKEELSWDNLPVEILFLIFKMIPSSKLPVCMFVCQTWKETVEIVLTVQKKWDKIFPHFVNISDFEKRCFAMNWRDIFQNYIRWYYTKYATVTVDKVIEVKGIKKIEIYRDNLIALAKEVQHYYNAYTLEVKSTVDWELCDGFHENEHMIVAVYYNARGIWKMKLCLKSDPNTIDKNPSALLVINDTVTCYKVLNNVCFVVTNSNVCSKYEIVNGKWKITSLGRYYGNPAHSIGLNEFEGEYYLLVRGGTVLWLDQENGSLQRCLKIDDNRYVLHSCDQNITVNTDWGKILNGVYKSFYWFFKDEGFVNDNIYNTPALVRHEDRVRIKRYPPSFSPKKSFVSPYNVQHGSGITCVFQHGFMLFLGRIDGVVELITVQNVNDDSSYEVLFQLDLKKLTDIPDPKVVSIEVHEEKDIQHLYLATETHIVHLHITHPDRDQYIWKWPYFMC